MIALSIGISNPFVRGKFKNLFCKAGNITGNKYWEFEITQYTSHIIGLGFDWTTKCDHAGAILTLTLATFTLSFNIYDNRHWNDTTNNWKVYYPDGTTDDPADD